MDSKSGLALVHLVRSYFQVWRFIVAASLSLLQLYCRKLGFCSESPVNKQRKRHLGHSLLSVVNFEGISKHALDATLSNINNGALCKRLLAIFTKKSSIVNVWQIKSLCLRFFKLMKTFHLQFNIREYCYEWWRTFLLGPFLLSGISVQADLPNILNFMDFVCI